MAKCDVPRFITSNVTWHGNETGQEKHLVPFQALY